MSPIEIKRSSWHFRWQAKLDIDNRYADNICKYSRGIVWAFIWTVIISTVALGYTASWGFTLAWLAAMAATLSLIDPELQAIPAMCSVGIAATLTVCGGAIFGVQALAGKVPEDTRAIWRSLHDKVCCRVTLS